MSKRCRTCGKIIYCPSAKNIFQQPESILLHHIKALSGLSLLNQNDFPSHICGPCEVSLREAIVFRGRIIRTQQLLLSSESVADALQELDLEIEEKLDFNLQELENSRNQRNEHFESDDTVPLPCYGDQHIKVEDPVLEFFEEPLKGDVTRKPGKQNVETLETGLHEEGTEYDHREDQNIQDPLEYLNNLRVEWTVEPQASALSQKIKTDKPVSVPTSDATALQAVRTWNRGEQSIKADVVPSSDAANLQVIEPFNETFQYSSSESEAPPLVKVKKRRKKNDIPIGEPQVKLKRGQHRYPRPKLSKEEKRERDRKSRIQDLICEICGKPFRCPGNLKHHLQRHTGVKNFSCDQCPKRFYTMYFLKCHKFSHVKDKPYKCRYCENSYTDYSGRMQHERLKHTFYMPFKCTECDKSFATSNKLKRHMVCHTGVRDFHCKVCEMSFLSNNNLSTHYRSKSHKLKAENTAVEANNKDISSEVS